MKTIEILYLSENDMKSTDIPMKRFIEVVEEVFASHAEGQVNVPRKLFLDMRDFGHCCDGDVMPAYVRSCDMCGVKWIGGNPKNWKFGFPYLFSMLILNEPDTFRPLAIMSTNWLTAMRTGATAAIAAKYLAPHKYAEKVCIIGAGLQGKSSLLALNEVLKVEKVQVFDIRKKAQDRFIREIGEKTGLEIVASESAKQSAEGADIIVTATTADKNLIEESGIRKDGCFICSLGTFRELGIELIRSMDKIVVDNVEQAKHTGTLEHWFSKNMLNTNEIYTEFGNIVAGEKVGRESDTEKILAVLTGMGSEDILLANLIYRKAERKKIGQILVNQV